MKVSCSTGVVLADEPLKTDSARFRSLCVRLSKLQDISPARRSELPLIVRRRSCSMRFPPTVHVVSHIVCLHHRWAMR